MVAEEKKGLFGIFKKKQKVAEEIKKPTDSAKFEIENEIASIQKLLDEQNLRDSKPKLHENDASSANMKNANDLAISGVSKKDEKPDFNNTESVSLHEHSTEKNKMHKVDSVLDDFTDKPDDFTDDKDKLNNADIKTSTKKDETDEDFSEIMSFDELDKASNNLEENSSPVEVDELFPRVDKKMSQKKKRSKQNFVKREKRKNNT